MRYLLLLVCFFFFTKNVFAQPKKNVCDYFDIEVIKKDNTFVRIKVHTEGKDTTAFAVHLKKYANRFDYFMMCCSEKMSAQNMTDSNKRKLLCNYTNTNVFFLKNFPLLLPQLTKIKASPISFSEEEMMIVASRFFYCQKIREKDTAVIRKICIGINGVKEFEGKNYECLEAFCFDAIFKMLSADHNEQILDEFSLNAGRSLKQHSQNFSSFDSLTLNVRKDCFEAMQKSENLRKYLLSFYDENYESINFTILKGG